PLGCEAAPNPPNPVHQKNRVSWFCDGFAAEREQAPSPQMPTRHKSPLAAQAPSLQNLIPRPSIKVAFF
ncbi:hypothetical protein, partial [Pseudomonas sp. PS02303]|uniref:hypothetical protein n=1 Tax=Pseudomonas sp. PS02303 TaxID=2991429 RepID=UPI00249AA054